MSEFINTTLKDGILFIRMSRPDKKNALTAEMYAAMADALNGAGVDDQVRVVVFTGEADSYTAGNDLKDFLENPPDGPEAPVILFLGALSTISKPVVAAVNGLAIGVGTTMLLHCDFVYAAASARFALPFVNLALVPEAASSLLLPRRAGYLKAAELLMLGETFDATEALACGIVGEICEDDAVMDRAMETARKLAVKPADALKATKQLMRSDSQSVDARMTEELEHFMTQLSSFEAKEAFTAFQEKRAPDFNKVGRERG